MATRNLTRKFLEIRNAAKANRAMRSASKDEENSDSELLEGKKNSSYKGKDSLPPVWVDKIEQVESDMNKINLKIKELGDLHTSRLKVNFEADESLQEREIDIVTQEITGMFHHADSVLKQIGKLGDESKISQAEMIVRQNMQRSVAKKLQGLSTSFRQSQKKYLTNLQNQKQGSGAQAFDFLQDQKKSALLESDNGFTSAQMQITEDMEAIVNQRDEEITKIAKSIEELAAIFKELAVLVIDQGTILDRIDYNMEQVLQHTEEGLKQLNIAEDHQKSAMSVRCIILLCVLIAIMLGVVVLKNTQSKK